MYFEQSTVILIFCIPAEAMSGGVHVYVAIIEEALEESSCGTSTVTFHPLWMESNSVPFHLHRNCHLPVFAPSKKYRMLLTQTSL